MPITKERTLDYVNIEWGSYVERFHRLPTVEQEQRVTAMGFESFRDLLAHILAWWDEGMEVIRAIAQGREFERRRYDFDVFNAEAVAKYKSWEEAAFLDQFEGTRQKIETGLKSIDQAVFENRRVHSWANGIFIHHAREHLVALSRFMVMDLLQNEWAEYVENFNRLDDEKKREFLAEQGFESFRDLIAHIIGWWEEAARVIAGILNMPGFAWQNRATDAFNRELTEKYSTWLDDDLFSHFESVRAALIDLTAGLPDDAFLNGDIAGWLKDDVVGHYDDHPIPR